MLTYKKYYMIFFKFLGYQKVPTPLPGYIELGFPVFWKNQNNINDMHKILKVSISSLLHPHFIGSHTKNDV